MSFNGSGTYVPPAGQPVATGTVIQSATFNTLVTDIGNTFNNVLPRDGQAPMLGQLKITDGTSAIPGIAFNSEASTGIFRPTQGALALVASGVENLRINSAGRIMIGTTTDDGTNKLQVNGPAKVAGATTLASTLAVSGNTSLSSALSVSGNGTVGGTFSVSGGVNTSSVGIGATTNANASVEIGYTGGAATTPFIDFHSGATATDFDARILASGGNGITGAGTLNLVASNIGLQGTVNATGPVSLASTLAASGNTTVGGTLAVSGTSTFAGNVGLGTSSPSQYSHGGSARVLEILNTGAVLNSQSHLMLSTSDVDASSSIGTVSYVMPGVSNATKLMAYIGAGSDASHTSASPSSVLKFATRSAGGAVTEVVKIDGNGNMLLSTSNVQGKLTTKGTVGVLSPTEAGVAQFLIADNGDATLSSYSSTGSTLLFKTASAAGNVTERARLDNAGNLLLNTTTPVGLFTVNSSTSSAAIAIQGKSSGNVAPDLQIARSSTSTGVGTGPSIQFNDTGTTANSRMIQAGAGNLQFFGFGGNYWTEHARLDINGNLLVGTTSNPINAKVVVSGAVQAGGGTVGTTAVHNQGAYLEWNKDNGGGATWLLNQRGGGPGGIVFGEVDTANNITTRMSISPAGNLLIGPSSDNGYKLQVNGGATINGQTLFAEGTVSAPGISFQNDGAPDSGLYHISDGQFGVTCNTNPIVTWGSTYGADYKMNVRARTGVSLGANNAAVYESAANRLCLRTGAAGSDQYTQVWENGNFTGSGSGTMSGYFGYYCTGNTASNPSIGMTHSQATNGSKTIRIGNGGNMEWINSAYSSVIASLTDAGNFSANVITQTSDENTKENWQALPTDFLTKLAATEKVGMFDWIETKQTSLGVGAQSLEKFLPAAVHTDDEGKKTVNYGGAAMVSVVELAKLVLKLEARIAELEGKQ